MSNSKFRWQCKVGGQKYYSLISNGYYLRCEKMEENIWFWGVYCPEGDLLTNSKDKQIWGESLKQAKEIAESSYLLLIQKLSNNLVNR